MHIRRPRTCFSTFVDCKVFFLDSFLLFSSDLRGKAGHEYFILTYTKLEYRVLHWRLSDFEASL